MVGNVASSLQLLTIAQVAKLLAVRERTVYNLRKAGMLQCVRRGPRGGVGILEESVRAYIRTRLGEGAANGTAV